jgi:hypothetical protein
VIAEHAAALIALLDAVNDSPALVVYDGKVPNGTGAPYVLVYVDDTDPEFADSRPLTGASQRYVMRATCHSVGANALAARMVADRVRTALLDVVPTVTGRTCLPIRREDGQPVDRDETTGIAVFDKVDVYRVESIPA